MTSKPPGADRFQAPKNPSIKKSTTPSWIPLQLFQIKLSKRLESSKTEWAMQVELMSSCWNKAKIHHEPWHLAAKETSVQGQPAVSTTEPIIKRSKNNFNEEFEVCLWTNTVHDSNIIRARANQFLTKDCSTITAKSKQTWCIQEISKKTWTGIWISPIKMSIVNHLIYRVEL